MPSKRKRRSPLAALTKRYPALRLAQEELYQKLWDRPEIGGIGIGRKVSETTGETQSGREETGGYCITVTVNKKIPDSKLGESAKIPGEIRVTPPGKRKSVPVPIDILSMPNQMTEAEFEENLEQARRRPTARKIRTGMLFAVSRNRQTQPGGNFSGDAWATGTAGAIVKVKDGNDTKYKVVTAGHVFSGKGKSRLPNYSVGVGAYRKQIDFIRQPHHFDPDNIETLGELEDVAVMDCLYSNFSNRYPTDVDKKLATSADWDEAMSSSIDGTYMLVERLQSSGQGQWSKLPLDLVSTLPKFKFRVGNRRFITGFCWVSSQLPGHYSKGGDSGAPIYIASQSDGVNKMRLLGFHFYRYRQRASSDLVRGIYSLAVDARSNLNYWFGSGNYRLV